MSEIDLAPVLEYLQGLGWEELYAPQPQPQREQRAGASAAGARAAAPAAGGAGARGPSSWAAVRATLAEATPGAKSGRAAPASRAHERAASIAEPAATSEAAAPPAISPLPPAAGELAVPADPAGRVAALAAVAAEALACTRCKLAAGRKTVVFGTGDPQADLMFIGEGPGAEEDRQGLPFVGAAGQLLDRIIAAIGLRREQVYICNVVKCRPPGNRDPQPDEVAACRGFLEAQVRLVQPRVIVALGRVAGQTLLGSDETVGRLRGRWHDVLGVPVRVTYHPAAILRDGSYRRPTWDDMQLVRDRLGLPAV